MNITTSLNCIDCSIRGCILLNFYLQIPVLFTEIRVMSAVVVRNSERHSQVDSIRQTVKKRYEEAYK